MKHQICVLGGSGFVGERVVSTLAAQGHSIRVLTRHRERHRNLLVLPTVEVMDADVHKLEDLKQHFAGQDTVINLIGILNEKRDNGKGFYHAHVELAQKVIEACMAQGVKRLLHMSALNANPATGSSYYLRSKGEAEQRIHAAQGIKVTSFRPSVTFGPGDDFINRFAKLLRMTPGVFPLACGQSRFAPVYVGDVAQAFVRSLDNPATYGQRYNLCGPHEYTLQQLVQYTAELMGLNRRIISLGKFSSLLQANVLQYFPGKPFSRDNYRSLQMPATCKKGEEVLRQVFGIEPKTIEAEVPRYLINRVSRQQYMDFRRHAHRE
jgi:nucleoside-diphosphate-sugar epimerase